MRSRLRSPVLPIVIILAVAILLFAAAMEFWRLRGGVIGRPNLGGNQFVIAALTHGEEVTIPQGEHGIVTCPAADDPAYRWLAPEDYAEAGTFIYEYTQNFTEKDAEWIGENHKTDDPDSPTLPRFRAGRTYYVRGAIDVRFACSLALGAAAGSLVVEPTGGAQVIDLGPVNDLSGRPIRYSVDLPPSHGDVTISGNQATYVPDGTFAGSDAFTFMRSDLGERPSATDEDFLYDVETQVVTMPGGRQNFGVTYGDLPLKEIDFNDSFFQTISGGSQVQVEYVVTPVRGGADITYTVRNPNASGPALPHPNLRIPGILLPGDTAGMEALSQNGVIPVMEQNAVRTDGSGVPFIFSGLYPHMAYAPVVIARTKQFSVGISFYSDDFGVENFGNIELYRIPSTDSWRFAVKDFSFDAANTDPSGNVLNPSVPATIPPNSQRTYTASIRFGPPEHWLFTVAPYKEYYRSRYPDAGRTADRDRRPVMGIFPASWDRILTNGYPRGFKDWPLMTQGLPQGEADWQPAIDAWVQRAMMNGFQRLMAWSIAGVYFDYYQWCFRQTETDGSYTYPFQDPTCNASPAARENCRQNRKPFVNTDMCRPSNNYPPINATAWLPALEDDRGDFAQTFNVTHPAMSFGVYYGRASQLPETIDSNGAAQWEPDPASVIAGTDEHENMQRADPENATHIAFLRNELNAVLALGADEIGLDAPSQMLMSKRETWWDEMFATWAAAHPEQTRPKIMMEKSGPDFAHRRAANFGNHGEVSEPSQLAWYLNPGSDTWIAFNAFTSLSDIMNHQRWGYTPMSEGNVIDISSLNSPPPIVECFDGIGADGTCAPVPVRNNQPVRVDIGNE